MILGTIFFLLIGLGFMFIEIGVMQIMSVFMGHPVYALSITLFSIILSTGIWAACCRKGSCCLVPPKIRSGFPCL